MEMKDWIVINYSLPKEPSRVRVSIWRKLKKKGAVTIGQSMWILPYNESHVAFLSDIMEEVRQNQGEAYVFRADFLGDQSTEAVIHTFNLARDEEYREVLEKCEDYYKEIDKETKKENYTFAEIEENEYELDKMISWYRNITERDYFGASLKSRSEQELDKCRRLFNEFSDRVYERNINASEGGK